MWKDIIGVIWNYIKWGVFRGLHGINKDTIILVLANENKKLDEIAVKRFSELLNKRYAKRGIILVQKERYNEITCQDERVKIIAGKPCRIEDFYSLYCFYAFTNNIFFTYIDTPKENHLRDYLKDSDIEEADIVNIALFRLGNV